MNSSFVLNLKYSFHNLDYAYLIFDMCNGGDLKYHLRTTINHCFDPIRTQFYGAEILLGLEHIHSFNIVYRDLKVMKLFLYINLNTKKKILI
jgi:serine/threonine protein kinase